MAWTAGNYGTATDGTPDFQTRALTDAEAGVLIASPPVFSDLEDEAGSGIQPNTHQSCSAKFAIWPLWAAVLWIFDKLITKVNAAGGFVKLATGGYLATVPNKFLYPGALKSGAGFTIATTDQVLLVDSTAGASSGTLPTAIGVAGKMYVIKDFGGLAGASNITIGTTGGQTIDGAATKLISTNYGVLRVISDGANWFVI